MFPITDLQGPRHRLRRPRARSRPAGEVPELARDAALSQGARAVQRRIARGGRRTTRTGHRRRRLHGRRGAGGGRLRARPSPRSARRSPRISSSSCGASRRSRSCASTATARASKAAFRAVDTALPHLKPGASLSFAFLPDGLDPDDLIRQQGPEAFETALARARPLSDVLFEREWALGDWSTPERRAGLEQQLRALVSRIERRGVRNHYRRDLARRLDERWGSGNQSRSEGRAAGAWDGNRGQRACYGR